MMRNKPKSEEFKMEAVKRLDNRGSKTVSEIAEELGIHDSRLYAWRKQYADAARKADGSVETVEEENARLRRENRELQLDRDALLKSIAVFAKDRK